MFWDPRPFTSNWGWSNATFLFNKYRFHFVLNIFGAPGASVCRTLGATRRRDGQCCGEKGALRSRSCSPDVTLEIFAMYRVCVCVYYCREMYTDVLNWCKLMYTDIYCVDLIPLLQVTQPMLLCCIQTFSWSSWPVEFPYEELYLFWTFLNSWKNCSLRHISYIILIYICIYMFFQGTVQLSSCLVFQIRSSVWRTLWLTLLNSWTEGSLWENRAFFQ